MDMSRTIVPKSDQLNADDLIAAPVTVTIKEVRKGSLEQPVDVILEEFPGRAYRPSKSMRRVMVSAWGAEASNYAGHQLRLFRNPEIMFGREKVGGIEIAAMSHIDKALTVALTATRGKRKSFTVQPLEAPTPKSSAAVVDLSEEYVMDWVTQFQQATTLIELQEVWADAGAAGVTKHPRIVAAKDARKTEIAQ